MKKGDVIRIEYIGRLESGEIFDLTDADAAKKENIFNPKARYGSIPVLVGAGFVIAGLDRELEKTEVGEEKELAIEPQDAFGERKAGMVKTLSSKSFKQQPKPGMVVDFGNMIGRVQAVSGGRVRVDFNHPLAGKKLLYKVKIINKIDDTKQKIHAILEYFGIVADNVEIESGKARIFASAPKELKDNIAQLLMRHITEIENIEFIDSYQKKPNAK